MLASMISLDVVLIWVQVFAYQLRPIQCFNEPIGTFTSITTDVVSDGFQYFVSTVGSVDSSEFLHFCNLLAVERVDWNV